MAAEAWKIFDSLKEKIGDGTVDLDTHSFKVALWTNTTAPGQTDDSYTTVAATGGEVANGFGYTTGGWPVTGVTWNEAAGTVTFDMDNPTWTASGGSIVCRYAVLYDDSDAAKSLVARSLLDSTPADVTTTDGNTLELQIDAAGVFTLSGGW